MVMLVVSTTLTARQKPTTLDKQLPEDKEQVLFQRVYDAQMNGSDSDFYQAHEAFMNYLESRQDWEKYYRAWLNRVIYDVNHKYFHRAFAEINYITDDIKDRHQEQYLYTTHLGMGLFFNGRNQPEEGEKYFRRALQGIDAEKEPAAVFNSYLSLAQSLSFTRPAEAMACLDSLPRQMLQNPMYENEELCYLRCVTPFYFVERRAVVCHDAARYLATRRVQHAHGALCRELAAHVGDARREEARTAHHRALTAVIDDDVALYALAECEPALPRS